MSGRGGYYKDQGGGGGSRGGGNSGGRGSSSSSGFMASGRGGGLENRGGGRQQGGGFVDYNRGGGDYHRGGGGRGRVLQPHSTGYQNRGGGGANRGGGGGFRGGANVSDANYDSPRQVTPTSLKGAPFGWQNVPRDLDNTPVPTPPPSKGPGDLAQRTISLTTNNLALRHLQLPQVIYTYDIDIDLSPEDKEGKALRQQKAPPPGKGKASPRVEPAPTGDKDPPKPVVWREIVKKLLQLILKDNNPQHVATDFMKIIYTTFQLRLHDSYRIALSEIPDEGNSTTVYICKITDAGTPIHASQLMNCVSDMYQYFIVNRNPVPPNFVNVDRVLNIALKTTLNLSLTPVGRFSFYKEPRDGEENRAYDLGGGVVNWTGFSTLLTMGWKTFVNVDIANTAFVKGQSVHAALRELASTGVCRGSPDNARSFGVNDLKNALKLFKGVMVDYRTVAKPRTVMTGRVTEVLGTSPRDVRFTGSDGKETTVEAYFKKQYGIELQHPNGVCLQLRGRSVVPAEICRIRKGQAYNSKLSDAQTAAMIKLTAVEPATRLQTIKHHVKELRLEQDPVLTTFGVTVDTKLHSIDAARVLPPPTLIYGGVENGKQKWVTPPRDGVWSMTERGNTNFRFVKPAEGFTFGVINVDKIDRGTVMSFVSSLCGTAASLGLNLGTADAVMANYTKIDGSRGVMKALRDFVVEKNLSFALVIIPFKDKELYGTIKTASEIQMEGQKMILTQCVQSKNVMKADGATIQNLLNKMNMKLGGVNYYMHTNTAGGKDPSSPWNGIGLLTAPVLIIGADVTHPGSESKFPSLAAVTGSTDRTGMPYQTHLQAQRKAAKGAAEVITGLSEIIQKFIKTFVLRTGHKPRKIIYYRDGVGDGQFGEVLQTEMMALRAGCEAIGNNDNFLSKCTNDIALGESLSRGAYQPKITFVAVQKRHKVRFFPNNPQEDGVGRMQNAPPGTVVDTDIVKPTITDFYLLSHTGIQGTSRPTRYQVLWDDSDLSANELETLSYYLCYMYCRCTRSVSYPAPTYYAHLGAARAKAYTELLDDRTLEDISLINERIQRSEAFQKQFRMHFV